MLDTGHLSKAAACNFDKVMALRRYLTAQILCLTLKVSQCKQETDHLLKKMLSGEQHFGRYEITCHDRV